VLLTDWDEQQAARADENQAICAAGELGSLLGHEVGLCMGLWLSVPSAGIEYVPMLSAGAQRVLVVAVECSGHANRPAARSRPND
jgi:hypothetical protein